MPTVETTNGSQTFQYSSTKVYLFGLHLGFNKREFVSKFGEQHGRIHKIYASEDGYEGNGVWRRATIDLPEGTVVLITAQQSRNGIGAADGAILLRIRDGAALLRVNVLLGTNMGATYDRLPAFVGKADILSPDEAKDYGYELSPNFVKNFFDTEEIEELYEIDELQSATSGAPETIRVDIGNGEKRAINIAPARKRRIRTRR